MTRLEYLKSAVASHTSDDCLNWPFAVDIDGYGKLPYSENGKKLKVSAHRVSFLLVHGRWPIPNGLHACDNPRCFNPKHISEGSTALNQQQKAERGRSLRGELQHDAKLTVELVIQAREEYATGLYGFGFMAKKYGVSAQAMRWAVTGKTWPHIPGAVFSIKRGRILRDVCRNGHLKTPDNLYIYGRVRQCKKCTQIRASQRRLHKTEGTNATV